MRLATRRSMRLGVRAFHARLMSRVGLGGDDRAVASGQGEDFVEDRHGAALDRRAGARQPRRARLRNSSTTAGSQSSKTTLVGTIIRSPRWARCAPSGASSAAHGGVDSDGVGDRCARRRPSVSSVRRKRENAVHRIAIRGRLVADDPVEGGGDAHGSAGVGADRHRRQPARNDDGRSRRRAAGDPRRLRVHADCAASRNAD